MLYYMFPRRSHEEVPYPRFLLTLHYGMQGLRTGLGAGLFFGLLFGLRYGFKPIITRQTRRALTSDSFSGADRKWYSLSALKPSFINRSLLTLKPSFMNPKNRPNNQGSGSSSSSSSSTPSSSSSTRSSSSSTPSSSSPAPPFSSTSSSSSSTPSSSSSTSFSSSTDRSTTTVRSKTDDFIENPGLIDNPGFFRKMSSSLFSQELGSKTIQAVCARCSHAMIQTSLLCAFLSAILGPLFETLRIKKNLENETTDSEEGGGNGSYTRVLQLRAWDLQRSIYYNRIDILTILGGILGGIYLQRARVWTQLLNFKPHEVVPGAGIAWGALFGVMLDLPICVFYPIYIGNLEDLDVIRRHITLRSESDIIGLTSETEIREQSAKIKKDRTLQRLKKFVDQKTEEMEVRSQNLAAITKESAAVTKKGFRTGKSVSEITMEINQEIQKMNKESEQEMERKRDLASERFQAYKKEVLALRKKKAEQKQEEEEEVLQLLERWRREFKEQNSDS